MRLKARPGDLFRWGAGGLALVLVSYDDGVHDHGVLVLGKLPEHYGPSAGDMRVMTVAASRLHQKVQNARRRPGEQQIRAK